MANSKSALKRARQAKKRAAHNRVIKSRVKAARRALNEAIESGDKEAAGSSLRVLASAADRAAKTGVLHKNAASRLKAIYTRRLSALA